MQKHCGCSLGFRFWLFGVAIGIKITALNKNNLLLVER
jgi:hypothetical protein